MIIELAYSRAGPGATRLSRIGLAATMNGVVRQALIAVAETLREKWPEGPIHDHDFAANTHILAHASRILATVENGALPYEISDELEMVAPCDFSGSLRAGFAAHIFCIFLSSCPFYPLQLT
jgi:carotenoid cleavage dioxygenase-like enzyme